MVHMLIKLQENRIETSRTSKVCIFLWVLDSIFGDLPSSELQYSLSLSIHLHGNHNNQGSSHLTFNIRVINGKQIILFCVAADINDHMDIQLVRLG